MARVGRSFPLHVFSRRRRFSRQVTTQQITFTGIPSTEAFGTHSLSAGLEILLTGIASGEAFGTTKVNMSIKPTGIASAESIPGPAKLNQKITFTGIASAQAFGTATVATVRIIRPTAILTAEVFGSTTLSQDIGIRYPLRLTLDDMYTKVLVDFR